MNARIVTKTGKRIFAGLLIGAAALGTGTLLDGQGARMGDAVLRTAQHDPAKELAMKIAEPFTFAAVGDVIIRRPIGQLDDPGFQNLVKVMRAADMTYANMEGPIIDESDPAYHGPPAGAPRTTVADLKAMGIRIMTTANNHTMDGGDAGMFMTNRLLDEAGIAHAGSGKDLQEAREARLGITPKGVVGIVGMYSIDPSSSPPESRYTAARPNWPGVNPLRVMPHNVVSAAHLKSLKEIRDAAYAHRSEVPVPVLPVSQDEPADRVRFFGNWYKVGEKVGSLSYSFDFDERVAAVRGGPNATGNDLNPILQSIRAGKQNSDFMVVAIHCHQNSYSYQAYSHDSQTPDFLVELAHRAIDNGADVFVGHGVHTLRGVEIYKGKPIFYGISNFVYHEGPEAGLTSTSGPITVADQTHQPENRQALLTTSRYEGGRLVEVRLYPADLGVEQNRTISKAGLPMTPSPQQAQRILRHMQDISKPFGTTIAIENNVGVIRIPPPAATTSSSR